MRMRSQVLPPIATPHALPILTDGVLGAREAALTRGGRVDRSVLKSDELLIAREGRLSVFYAPFDSVNPEARLVLLGLTPGWQQMCIAIETYGAACIRSRPAGFQATKSGPPTSELPTQSTPEIGRQTLRTPTRKMITLWPGASRPSAMRTRKETQA
jgi:hypothetical protein